MNGAWTTAAVHQQEELAARARLNGPAIVEQAYTTLLIPAGWSLAVAESGDLVATRESGT